VGRGIGRPPSWRDPSSICRGRARFYVTLFCDCVFISHFQVGLPQALDQRNRVNFTRAGEVTNRLSKTATTNARRPVNAPNV
jgi:hypothetical protein